jgi:hypothetical protein
MRLKRRSSVDHGEQAEEDQHQGAEHLRQVAAAERSSSARVGADARARRAVRREREEQAVLKRRVFT